MTTSLVASPAPVVRRWRPRPGAVVGAIMLGSVLLLTAVVPLLPGYDPMAQDLRAALLPPLSDPGHPLGTDALGRDLLSRIALASAVTLGMTVLIVIMNALIGSFVGILAGYFGGRLETLITLVSNVTLAMPVVLLLIAICAVLRPSAGLTILVLGLTWWVGYARVTRNVAASLRRQDFVVSPLTQGADSIWVLTRHVVPNVWPHTLIIAATDVATIVLITSSLEYLGLGVQPPVPSWGSMIFDGQRHLAGDPWLALLPGLVMLLAVGGVQFLSQQFTAETRGGLLRKGGMR
ncbi:peptide/nickel transport system permease protein [Conyzicola lurida]|uniref:Peptide/nickel transport system permease protein n=1 Tax=Conyzicola lurida TaxID=1172621 RepID=A0A841AQY4_9MICO|nr:ABC transporter permease [Conyzicola lurida]MBB5843985.1 peptide/nickel transport system permease protein [Conyzicola lurida]